MRRRRAERVVAAAVTRGALSGTFAANDRRPSTTAA
jgi:hypothetical protein